MPLDPIRHAADAQGIQRRLSARLLDALKPLALDQARNAQPSGGHWLGERLFHYRCFSRERVARMRVPLPLIGIIINGFKEIWIGEHRQRFAPGEVFVMPANLDLELVNIPDRRGGRYESLVIEVSRPPHELAGMPFPRPAAPAGSNIRVRLTEELVEALAHAARALHSPEHAARLADIRLLEVLILLSGDPAASPLFQASLEQRLTWLVVAEPARRWTSSEIGRALGLGASTLRRRLADRGTSLRKILANVRMDIAYHLLTAGSGNVSEAAVAAGYASRSHFVRRFRSVYGAPPSAFCPRDRAPVKGRGV